MRSQDTTRKAAAIQEELFRQMGPERRLRVALAMSDSMRNVAVAGLRSRHPELSELELSRELLRILYGFVRRP